MPVIEIDLLKVNAKKKLFAHNLPLGIFFLYSFLLNVQTIQTNECHYVSKLWHWQVGPRTASTTSL